MKGMNRNTGAAITGDAQLQQSITELLNTPLGSRVMRRDYGSLLPELIDQPFNPTTKVRLYGATAQALMTWEPRLSLTQVTLSVGDTPGVFVLSLEGTRTDTPAPTTLTKLSVPLQQSALPSQA